MSDVSGPGEEIELMKLSTREFFVKFKGTEIDSRAGSEPESDLLKALVDGSAV